MNTRDGQIIRVNIRDQ